MEKSLYLFTLLITFASAQDPIVRITRTEPEQRGNVIRAQRGKDITIWCHVENLRENINVRFEKEFSSSVKSISRNEYPSDNTRYAIEKPKEFTWRLRIKAVQLTDSGVYICHVYLDKYSKSKAYVNVLVNAAPVFVNDQTTSDSIYKNGYKVILNCSTTGYPKPYIEWTRLGNALLPIGRERFQNSTLEIKSIKPQDRGVYRCRSWNIMGEIARDITVGVRFKAEIRVQNRILKQKLGYVIELQCLAETNPYPIGLSWKRRSGSTLQTFTVSSGRYVVNAVKGAFNRFIYELIINGVQQEDYGEYTCEINNVEGKSSAKILLEESEIPMPSIKRGIPRASANINQSISSISITLLTFFVATLIH
ncbi:DgyrCDS5274 [Dimorphilus gyrociliatus]|uniref:DgyrCDS5274 n=1 Tax=Dimorphilus gyrociliatus TaxID=2664684 RepID=A0A7I8VM32_9ANNE|nr:DgyrCDS5274 [Dimorphilus gyrociliatus]